MLERSIRLPTAFCILLRRQDSNLRPQAYETCKLPSAPLRYKKQGDMRKDSINGALNLSYMENPRLDYYQRPPAYQAKYVFPTALAVIKVRR